MKPVVLAITGFGNICRQTWVIMLKGFSKSYPFSLVIIKYSTIRIKQYKVILRHSILLLDIPCLHCELTIYYSEIFCGLTFWFNHVATPLSSALPITEVATSINCEFALETA